MTSLKVMSRQVASLVTGFSQPITKALSDQVDRRDPLYVMYEVDNLMVVEVNLPLVLLSSPADKLEFAARDLCQRRRCHTTGL